MGGGVADMEEYVVAFNTSEANVRSVAVDKTFCRSEMIDMYTSSLSRYYGKKYGDAIPWNNQIWTVARAENAIDALNTAYKFWNNGRNTNE